MGISSIDFLENIRWGGNIRCPHCYCLFIRILIGNSPWRQYQCNSCDNIFSVISGTMFSRTKLKPDQLKSLISLHIDKQLHRRPSDLCKEINVHHWTMTKLIQKVEQHTVSGILNTPQITVFEKLLRIIEIDKDCIPYFLFMYAYKIMFKSTPSIPMLSNLSGLNKQDTKRAVIRLKKSWRPDKIFHENCELDWYVWKNWEKDYSSVKVSMYIQALCLSGEISRNPLTEMYYIDD